MINDQGKSRQIDHIAITEYGVFVIETKNYAGSIYGKETSENWQQYLKGRKYLLKNPIHQNYGHFQIVKNVIFDETIYIEPIVIFTDRCKLNVTTKSKVIYASKILSYIKNKPKVLSLDKINEIYNTIIENRITDEEKIQDHNYNVQKYIEYKDNIANSGECPRCGAKLVIRNSSAGQFYGCSKYPKCKFTKNI